MASPHIQRNIQVKKYLFKVDKIEAGGKYTYVLLLLILVILDNF